MIEVDDKGNESLLLIKTGVHEVPVATEVDELSRSKVKKPGPMVTVLVA